MLAITQANISKLDTDWRQSGDGQAKGRCSKILVVDEHFLIREALRGVLKKFKSDAAILEAVNAYQALQLVSEHADVGLVLLELNLPDRDGFSVLSELRERHPTMSVVVLSARQDRNSMAKALDLGALGFIPKSEQLEIMLSALDLVFAGGVYVPPEILLREQRAPPIHKPASAPGARPVTPADLGLTERQVDVLALMMTGKSNKVISRVLNLAEPTVKNHVTAILKAIKVTNRTEAVIAVTDLGCEWPLVKSHALLDETQPQRWGP